MTSNSNKMYVVGYGYLDNRPVLGLAVSQGDNHMTILWADSTITTTYYEWNLYTIKEAMNKISRYGSTNI